jgi:predicted nucleic acid-binding protein
MVLVDTSVWIRFLANKSPYATALSRLLERDEVAGHDLIYGELLIGDPSGRGAMLSAYGRIHHAKAISHSEVVEFVRTRRLYGRGVGWIDVHLLASAIVGRMKLWTADQFLAVLAAELGIDYSLAR